MSRRTRTTKKLAQRIDLQYFTRPHAWRRWKFWLAVAVPALAAAWVLWLGVSGNTRVYSSGPMSAAHAVISNNCAACHVKEEGKFFRGVSDTACLACHDGPMHTERQMFTPSCASCHVDHRGAVKLAHTANISCTQCHASLEANGGAPAVERIVTSFTALHPQFRAVRPGVADNATIALNHKVHMKPGLLGPPGSGKSIQMECGDCHRTAAVNSAWPFGAPEFRQAALAHPPTHPLAAPPSRAYMEPIAYEKQCAACHTLEFDKRFVEQAPHEDPKRVIEFVVKAYRDYIARHPEEVRRIVRFDRQITGEAPRIVGPARNSEEWVRWQVEEAERLLWRKTCKQCHSLQFAGSNGESAPRDPFGAVIPVVAKPNMQAVWMPHAKFDHGAHQMLECTACHAQALTSTETRDILLPGIATCQTCHSSSQTSAGEGCYKCHSYHDWSKQKETKGRYTIPSLLRSE